ncbi:MAG: zinc ribbon domain-containing protein [Promethearchaeati archaeon]
MTFKKKYFQKSSIKSLVFISLIFTFSFLGVIYPYFQAQNLEKKKSNINISQIIPNKNVSIQFPKLIWIEAQIQISITSNESGHVNIAINDNYANIYFNKINETKILSGSNQTDTFLLKTQPKIQTFPGLYQFNVSINGLFEYTQSYEAILGLGYILMFILIGAFGIPFVYIIYKNIKKKDTSYVTPTETISYQSAEGVPAGKIKCPKCGSHIPEGLSFCPECGERIPEFLRFNPSSI